jgi:uncharacterized membrane protein
MQALLNIVGFLMETTIQIIVVLFLLGILAAAAFLPEGNELSHDYRFILFIISIELLFIINALNNQNTASLAICKHLSEGETKVVPVRHDR